MSVIILQLYASVSSMDPALSIFSCETRGYETHTPPGTTKSLSESLISGSISTGWANVPNCRRIKDFFAGPNMLKF